MDRNLKLAALYSWLPNPSSLVPGVPYDAVDPMLVIFSSPPFVSPRNPNSAELNSGAACFGCVAGGESETSIGSGVLGVSSVLHIASASSRSVSVANAESKVYTIAVEAVEPDMVHGEVI